MYLRLLDQLLEDKQVVIDSPILVFQTTKIGIFSDGTINNQPNKDLSKKYEDRVLYQ